VPGPPPCAIPCLLVKDRPPGQECGFRKRRDSGSICQIFSITNDLAILQCALDAPAAIVFPAPCRVCDATLTNASRTPICAACRASFIEITEPVCQCCGRPFVSPAAAQGIQPFCPLCRAKEYAFERRRSYAI
jgi:hypothetical protein